MFGAMPKEWVLTFEYEGGKVTMTVIARTFIGARGRAPTGATNVKVRQRKTQRANTAKRAQPGPTR